MLDNRDCENKLPADSELAQDLLLQLNAYKSMEPDQIPPRVLRELADAGVRPLNYFSVFFGNLEKSQSTGSWQT